MKPKSLGFDARSLERVDRIMAEKYVTPGKLPCAMTLVARGGEIAHWGVQGFADVERKEKLAEDTVFRIYSMTKPITSVALMMMVEEGKIALDDPVHRHIPEWKNLGVYKAGFIGTFQTGRTERPMLVVDLLRHTSGLTYGFQQRTNVDAAYRKRGVGELPHKGTLGAMIATLSDLPLEFSPGTAWNYSVATDVCGHLVEKLSGKPLGQFFRERIFTPLNMPDTGFEVQPGASERFASCYSITPSGALMKQDDARTSSYHSPPGFVSGGGGLVSTASDYLRFCRMLIGGGELDGVRLLGRKTVELMTMNHLPGGAIPVGDVAVAVQRGGLRRHRLRARLCRHARSRADAAARQRRRVFVGRRREHLFLDRPEGRPDHDLHDPVHAVDVLSAAPRVAERGVCGADVVCFCFSPSADVHSQLVFS